jgi:hypothetical protein
MNENVRRGFEMLCLTSAIFTSILLAVKLSFTKEIAERREIVFAIVGMMVISIVYFAVRIGLEAKKTSSNKSSEATR